MLTRRAAIHLCVVAGLVLLTNPGGRQPLTPAARAQTNSSRPLQRPGPSPSTPAAAETPAARELFQQHCVKCHGEDGKASRDALPGIPNFTDVSWQGRHSDAQLLASILDGKGKMPSWREKIGKEQAPRLVAYVRAFAPTTGQSGQKKPEGPGGAGLDERYHRLEEEMGELQRHFRELSKVPPNGAASKPSESPQREITRPSVPAAAVTPAARELFQQRCVRCHGADGTGSRARRRLPEIPDFTDVAWQARRSDDAQLLASILDGKGSEMPPVRGKISEEQARGLVAYVRAFAPTTGTPGQEEQEKSTRAEPAEAELPPGFLGKLIRWLGKFHPPAVHFPIALLTAAALAELLRMVTGKPGFDAVSRFCIWFGALSAAGAGVLGWFRGGFHLTDASGVMMTHRWLGTSTIVCAGLVLILSELSRRPDRHRARLWFRVTLLVVAVLVLITGFFGGAVVFGLDHYLWPR